MQELCKTCKRRNQCKEVENYNKYVVEHMRLREKSSLFDCEPTKCCLYEKEIKMTTDYDMLKTRNEFLETENRQLKDKIKTLQYINGYLAKKNRLFTYVGIDSMGNEYFIG